MPYPQNVETARAVQDIIRAEGAMPATIAILDGKVHIGPSPFVLLLLGCSNGENPGLTDDALTYLGKVGREAQKASRRDLAAIVAEVQIVLR